MQQPSDHATRVRVEEMASDVHPYTMAEDSEDKLLLLQNEQPQDAEIQSDPDGIVNRQSNGENPGSSRPFIISSGQFDEGDKRNFFIEPGILINNSAFHHVFVAAIVAGTATILVLLFPTYLTNFNDAGSDAYCALLFCSLSSWVLVSLAVTGFQIWKKSFCLRPPLAIKRLFKIGVYYGLSGLAVFYGRDRYRVGCHLQDSLAAAILPAAVVCHLFSSKLDSVCKFVCVASAVIGLFICVDFQIWDEYSCHGNIVTTMTEAGQMWSSDEHIIWTMIYLTGIGLLALFINLLEWELKGNMSNYSLPTIPMTALGIEDPQPSTSDEHSMVPISSIQGGWPSKLMFGHALVISMWLQFFSAITILALFWTDLFSFLGKAGSSSDFRKMMGSGFACVFGLHDPNLTEECISVAHISWPFVILYTCLFVALVYLIIVANDCSSCYIVGVLALALPLSTLWWSFFMTGSVIRWAPSFSGETGFTIVGFPLMVAALVLYKYYSEREKVHIIEA